MLVNATNAKEVENTITAHQHVLRIKPTQENIQNFLTYCNQTETLPESAFDQLFELPKVEEPLAHSNNLVAAAKIIEKTKPDKALQLATQAVTSCMTNASAYQHFLSLYQRENKQPEAVDLLVFIANQLKSTQKFSDCQKLLEFLKTSKITHPDLEKLYSETPYMNKIVAQDIQIKTLESKVEKLETTQAELLERVTALEGNAGYSLVKNFSTVLGGWATPTETPR